MESVARQIASVAILTGPCIPAVEAGVMVAHLIPLLAEARIRTYIHDHLVVN
jgi:hypothetical protein